MGTFDQFQDKVALNESRTGAAAAVVTTSENWSLKQVRPIILTEFGRNTLSFEKKYVKDHFSPSHTFDRATDALYWHEML